MNLFLAKTSSGPNVAGMTQFPGQVDLLEWCQQAGYGTSLLVLLTGGVYLLYGWHIYKPLITLNAAICGGYLGAIVGATQGHAAIGVAVGAIVASAASIPLMKWTVAVMGGVCGALCGASIWRMCGQPPEMAWAGALTGLVGFGMFSFVLFRGSIMMYTSLQGAMMVIIGLLGLAFRMEVSPGLAKSMLTQPAMLPAAVFIPAVLGLIFQQTHGPAEGGGGGKK
jgi:hypothetical protein